MLVAMEELLTASESILEDLLETQELEDGKVDGRVKTETTLVRTEGGVVLDTVTTVDLDLVLVVLPDDTELDDALGDGGDLESTLVLGVLLEESRVLKGRGKLCVVKSVPATLMGEPIATLGEGRHTLVGLLELGLRGKVRHDVWYVWRGVV